MKEFRICFLDPRGVNIEAGSEEEARKIIKDRQWEYGMDWRDGEPDIISVEEI